MIRANRRPLTGSMSTTEIDTVLAGIPASVSDFVLHGFESLCLSAKKGGHAPAIAHAKRCSASAEALLYTLDAAGQDAARRELSVLADEIHFA